MATVRLFTTLSFLVLWTGPIRAYESGAPCAAQHNLHPSSIYHGQSRDIRKSPPPYRFFIADLDELDVRTYTPGRVYTLRVIANDGAHFRGFLIQPRLATKDGSIIGNIRVGRFIVDQDQMDDYGIQFQECASYKNDSITHRNGTLKYFLETKWTAEKNYGPVQFALTMVQEQGEFWEMWQPRLGFMLPNERNGEFPAVDAEELKTENEEQLKKTQLLSEKLEYHKAKKEEQLGFFLAHDQTEADDDSDPVATTPSRVTKRKQAKATRPPVTTEAAEEVEDAATDADEAARPKATSPLVRKPTPKPPVEKPDEEGGDEEEVTTEEPKSGPLGTNHKLSSANLSKKAQIRPQNGGSEEEEGGDDSDSTSSPDATKVPLRIPLSSLGRLRELFKQGQKKNRNYTLTPEKVAELIPTPSPFKVKATSTPASDEETDAEGTEAPDAAPQPRHTVPAVNRFDFPTLAPFPMNKTKQSKSDETSDGSPPIPRLPADGDSEDGNDGEDTAPKPRTKPPKVAKPAQPVVRLLKGATVPPDTESETDNGDDKEAEEKPATTPRRRKTTRPPKQKLNATTITIDPDFEDITSPLPTVEAAPLEEDGADAGTTAGPEKTKATQAKSKSSGTSPKPKDSDDGEGPLPPAASALNEEETQEPPPPATRAVTVSSASSTDSTEQSTSASSTAESSSSSSTSSSSASAAPPTDQEGTPSIRTANPALSNGTLPVRRTVLVEGNGTVGDEDDASVLKDQDFCNSSPCFNKGTCINLVEKGRYQCRCSEGWTGQHCDVHDYCGKKSPCQNGGICVNNDFGYTCNCSGQWVGKNCEVKCPDNLCRNGGRCSLTVAGGFTCICRPGYTGESCDTDIDDCAGNPCRNGGTCRDKLNAFQCLCPEGYMGERCHRPCQNIYKSCPAWGEEGRCESTRHTTRWFDLNCGITCGQCVFRNDTVKTLTPLPPVLEPLQFLIGRWSCNTTHLHRFPIDFTEGNAGYYEEIEFAPVNVPQFGTPSINYTSIAQNNQFLEDVMVTHGFMTLKPSAYPIKVALMSIGNEGLTLIEEGTLPNDYTLDMKADYIAPMPAIAQKLPSLAKRQFTLYGGFLRETIERQTGTAPAEYFTKYYYKAGDFQIY